MVEEVTAWMGADGKLYPTKEEAESSDALEHFHELLLEIIPPLFPKPMQLDRGSPVPKDVIDALMGEADRIVQSLKKLPWEDDIYHKEESWAADDIMEVFTSTRTGNVPGRQALLAIGKVAKDMGLKDDLETAWQRREWSDELGNGLGAWFMRWRYSTGAARQLITELSNKGWRFHSGHPTYRKIFGSDQ